MRTRVTLILIYLLSQFLVFSVSHAQDWMPDTNLQRVVREKLEIPDEIPIHPGDMTGLTEILTEYHIESLKGLEHAVNVKFLSIARSEVSDLTPIAELENLHTLKLFNNRISDITPLAGLVNLEVLQLQNNQILDISPLTGLVNLKELNLSGNPIVDFTPIYGLTGIETLRLGLAGSGIPLDSEVLQRLNPVDGPVVCEIARAPIHARLENLTYPSVFQACGGIVNLPELSWEEVIAYHDIFFCQSILNWAWFLTPDENWKIIGDPEESPIPTDRIRTLNPNIMLLTSIEYYVVGLDEFPDDWPYYVRDESGNRVEIPGWDQFAIDFTHPAVQEMVIQKAAAAARCGFDGIQIDHWNKTKNEEERTAQDRILQGIRNAVGDDFLIMVTTTNTMGTSVPRHAEYINGVFMETYETYEGGYTYAGLARIEKALLWAEENLREPQINCLAGRGVRNELLDSPRNIQWMRLWTTMSLTHSDGYVMFTMGGSLDHPPHPFDFWPGHADLHAQGERHTHQNTKYWYDFYDADLGRPVGGDETKGKTYKNINGLFIREFTNGWVVYNRSGKEQAIQLPEQAKGVSNKITDTVHTIPDLDGEIYLRAAVAVDINGDGEVNILDLVLVANALGETAPDLNGDGIVNILDLVRVANAF